MKVKLHSIQLLLIISILLLCSFTFSCTSYGAVKVVANEEKIILKNLATEYANIADSYFDLKKYDKAITYYDKALDIQKKDVSIMYKLARTYALSSKWYEAIDLFQSLLKLDPNNNLFNTSLAYVYAMSGNLDAAMNIYEELYSNNNYNIELLNNYTRLLIDINDIEKAEMLLTKMTEIDPEHDSTKKLTDAINALKEMESDSDNENNTDDSSVTDPDSL